MAAILDREEGGSWSSEEMEVFAEEGVITEKLLSRPERLVVLNDPSSGRSFEEILGCSDFTTEFREYSERWV